MTAGVLTDKGMNDAGKMIARINDKPFEVPGYVLPYLAFIEKGSQVEYSESNEVITKIAAVKKAEESQPVKSTVTKPAVKPFDGAILSINHEQRKLALDGGAILVWSKELDDQMKNFHARYKCKVEHDGERLISIVSTFVPSNGNGGKSTYHRNEKLIAFLALHRDAVQAATFCHTPDVQDYNKFMDVVYDRAKTDLEDAIKDFGGSA
ncbi:MAG: hypothetical protein M0Q91_16310 [Methanoregula sp.]|jgi:hypothetical protein|nr:hypothetical protein [Methanoregula sp.]